MEFKSQIGQDKWVCEHFNYKRDGFFLDIGANDGIFYSNTYYLEKELGWKGICVEPNKSIFAELIKCRDCICENKFICDENKTVELYEENETYTIEAVTLIKLLAQHDVPPVIDYVSIDVDGGDAKVLMGFPFDKHQATLWTIEHNLYIGSDALKKSINKIMLKNGYVIAHENISHGGNIFEDWYTNNR